MNFTTLYYSLGRKGCGDPLSAKLDDLVTRDQEVSMEKATLLSRMRETVDERALSAFSGSRGCRRNLHGT